MARCEELNRVLANSLNVRWHETARKKLGIVWKFRVKERKGQLMASCSTHGLQRRWKLYRLQWRDGSAERRRCRWLLFVTSHFAKSPRSSLGCCHIETVLNRNTVKKNLTATIGLTRNIHSNCNWTTKCSITYKIKTEIIAIDLNHTAHSYATKRCNR